jgi:Alpha amylase, catalytic domain
MRSSSPSWWRNGVLYQVYPRSFADSNGDGVGDIAGIRDRLDYLEWLGIDGVWLNPTFPSPNKDWGYDVSHYGSVHPDLGRLDDLDRLVADARARGIRVLLDLVPAHTSDRHDWFADSRASREASKRGWYLWRDEATEQESVFGGPAWTYDELTQQHYHQLFLADQPDLNWMNPAVRDAFDEILRFWFDAASPASASTSSTSWSRTRRSVPTSPRSTRCYVAGARSRMATTRNEFWSARPGSSSTSSRPSTAPKTTSCTSRSTSPSSLRAECS